jgi:hypothetical protein
MGGQLKFAEFTSGRFADVLSNLYLGYATLWYYEKYNVKGAEPVLDYAMMNILHEAEEAFHEMFANFSGPVPGIGPAMQIACFPSGKCYPRPGDALVKQVSAAISTDSAVRSQLAQDLFISKDTAADRIALINATLPKAISADAILAKVRKEKRKPTSDEQVVIDAAEAAREIIIQVDSFKRLGQEMNFDKSWSKDARPAYTAGKVAVGAAP